LIHRKRNAGTGSQAPSTGAAPVAPLRPLHDGLRQVNAPRRRASLNALRLSINGDQHMRTTTIATALALATSTAGLDAGPALAQGDICSQLWVARNSIYKAAGYCFKTQRAIRYFGNAGCIYDVEAALPLSPGERARVNAIVAQERMYGCR
jgi:hypothetical protein